MDRVARYHARTRDDGETREVVDVYVRRLVGRAALVCGTLKDFRAVRQPIRDTMLRNPELLGLNSPTEAEANLLVAGILQQKCEEEMAYSGASECPAILRAYAALCDKGGREPEDDRAACEVAGRAVAAIPRPRRRARRAGRERAVKGFRDEAEFRRVFERVFELMNETPAVGRKLRDARAPHRFLITDLGLEFNVTGAPDAEEAKGRFLRWTWGPADWEPVVTMRMASDVANRFFQGKESVPLALALGRVKLSGPPLTLLQLAPVTNPIHPVYRAWLKKSGLDHLLA